MFEFDACGALLHTSLPLPKRSGKVRDVYDLGDRLCIVSTDRISAFDFVLPCGIPDKGRILTRLSEFWFNQLSHRCGIEHHWLDNRVPDGIVPDFIDPSPLHGRVMIVRKAAVVPYECVVRGYLEGSGWKEYQTSGSMCGNSLPAGLRQCERLPEPIFTPTTKAAAGHDEPTTLTAIANDVGLELATRLRDESLKIFAVASEVALAHGLLLADTKFEFGLIDERVILIDEVLTPDSSRYWAADAFQSGRSQVSFDKQFVREWLLASDWDRISPPPALPVEIVMQTQAKYLEALNRLQS